ncbi:MAG TPA: glycosyltransferase family A protein [Cyclobacteriaceae bacterium]|nr:glycosyltransferase family A protein [Cyclobacteriaceae bacterium]
MMNLIVDKDSPFFSVVIPTYNREHLIGKTLESILSQTFTDFEVLVVDDGSKDNTRDAVTSFLDPRIKYFKKENGERGAARNFGASHSRGAYVNFFDSDDIMYPNHLQTASSVIGQHQSPAFFHLGYDLTLADRRVITSVNNFDDSTARTILFNNKLSCNGSFVRRDVAEKYPFREDRTLASSEDWELWIRLICRFEFIYSNEVTSAVVNHDARSLFTIQPAAVVKRDLLLLECLKADPVVIEAYGRSFPFFEASRYTFFMLCYSQQRQKREVMKWAKKAIQAYPLILLTRRFLASVKNTFI